MIEIPHLDLNIVRHCNMRCAACSHASPFVEPWSMSLEIIERDLRALKPILHPHSVAIVGGEPTLHKELVKILGLVSRIRMDDEHMVVTNGKLLPRMPEAFWARLECLKISIYPSLDRAVLELVERKEAEFNFHLVSEEFPEFFQQFDVVPDGSSFHSCPWKSDCYTVHDGFFHLCPQSTFFPSTFMQLDRTIDGLPLEGVTEEKLRAFMDRKEPFQACRICRAYGPKIPWHESKSKAEWIEDSTIKQPVICENIQ